MTERTRSFFTINVGHVLTCLITLSAAFVGYGRLEQRVSSLEGRMDKSETAFPIMAETVNKMDGKMDVLILITKQLQYQNEN